MKVAVLKDNKVINVIIIDNPRDANEIESDEARIGNTYKDGKFYDEFGAEVGTRSHKRFYRKTVKLDRI